MKYFIINTVIFDGEFEYFSQSPVMAHSLKEALEKKENDAIEWTQYDYREYKITLHKEITEDEYNIISRYVY